MQWDKVHFPIGLSTRYLFTSQLTIAGQVCARQLCAYRFISDTTGHLGVAKKYVCFGRMRTNDKQFLHSSAIQSLMFLSDAGGVPPSLAAATPPPSSVGGAGRGGAPCATGG